MREGGPLHPSLYICTLPLSYAKKRKSYIFIYRQFFFWILGSCEGAGKQVCLILSIFDLRTKRTAGRKTGQSAPRTGFFTDSGICRFLCGSTRNFFPRRSRRRSPRTGRWRRLDCRPSAQTASIATGAGTGGRGLSKLRLVKYCFPVVKISADKVFRNCSAHGAQNFCRHVPRVIFILDRNSD